MTPQDEENLLLTVEKPIEKASVSALPAATDLGIDTVRLFISVNLDACENDPSLWGYDSTGNSTKRNRTYQHFESVVSYKYADVKVSLFPNSGIARLDFNAARLVTPKSRALLHPDDLMPLVDKLLWSISHLVVAEFDEVNLATGEIVRRADWADQVGVTRIDLAKNIFIDSPEDFKRVVEQVQPLKGKGLHKYWDAEGGWTLWNTTKTSGSDRMYDKAAELAAKSKDDSLKSQNMGWYRFETQLQKDRIKRNGFSKLSGVSAPRVEEVLEQRWEKCGWGVKLPEKGEIMKILEKIDVKLRLEFLGFLVASEDGSLQEMHEPQIVKLRKIAKNLGVTPGVPMSHHGPLTRQVSFREGRIVSIISNEEI